MPRCLWLGTLALCLPLGAWAQRVTVDFDQVPLEQALDEIKGQTGWQIWHSLRGQNDQPAISLQMEDAPLRVVLRAIGQQAGCHFQQAGRRNFHLRWGPDPAEECPSTQVGPYTVRVRSIRITDARILAFDGRNEQPLTFQNDMAIELSVEADENTDLEAVAAVHPGLTAVDNIGQTVQPRVKELPQWHSPNTSWQHQGHIRASVTMDEPSPEAVSLRTLEGDIVVYTDVEPVRFEFPLEGPRQPQTSAGHTVTLTSVELTAGNAYEIKAKWELPPRGPEQRPGPWRTPSYEAYLVAADGTRISAFGGGGMGGSTTGNRMVYDCTWRLQPRGNQVPAKFALTIVVKSEQTQSLHYKLEDVPLPTWGE
ncbi:MAG: hypothetical protein ACE5R4_11590 [Armatimonadota bacterium]